MSPWRVIENEAYRCPTCGAPVMNEPDCPGYPGFDKIAERKTTMVCHPPCGGAELLECTDKTCPWWYRDPNNRSTEGYKLGLGMVPMGVRPEWFDLWFQENYATDEDDDGFGVAVEHYTDMFGNVSEPHAEPETDEDAQLEPLVPLVKLDTEE